MKIAQGQFIFDLALLGNRDPLVVGPQRLLDEFPLHIIAYPVGSFSFVQTGHDSFSFRPRWDQNQVYQKLPLTRFQLDYVVMTIG